MLPIILARDVGLPSLRLDSWRYRAVYHLAIIYAIILECSLLGTPSLGH